MWWMYFVYGVFEKKKLKENNLFMISLFIISMLANLPISILVGIKVIESIINCVSWIL